MQTINNNDVSSSRSLNLTSIDEDRIVGDALEVLKRNTEKFFKSPDDTQSLNNPIKFLGLSVGKFESQDSRRSNTIQDMFKKTIDAQPKPDESKNDDSNITVEEKPEEQSDNKRDEPVAKKATSILDMFKAKNGESSVGNVNNGQVEELHAADPEKARIKPTTPATAKRPFFASLIIPKPVASNAQNENRGKATASVAEEEPSHETNADDQNVLDDELLLEEVAKNEHTLRQMKTPSPVASTSTADYTQTYAEFYRPPPTLEIPKVKCSQCSKLVNAHDLQVHTDGHFAFQLTQEQRAEFQSQLQTSTVAVAAPPAAKKMKTAKSSSSTTNTFSIDKFLVKKDASHDESVAGTSSAIGIGTEVCSECGKAVPIADILEHMDYHAAKKLHDELLESEQKASRSVASDTKKTKPTAGKGTKKKNDSSNKSSNNNSLKSIVTFFQNPLLWL